MKSTARLSPVAECYIRATNDHNAPAFQGLFADSAIVDDAGRVFRGFDAIKEWSDREIFAARVMLEVMNVEELNGEVAITTKVDGNFDRTGLPDPVIIVHRITVEGDKIVGLNCRLAGEWAAV